MRFIKKYFPYFLLFFFLVLHLPFLTCDPDPVADPNTRGAFTDEGLYTSQIRNLADHGHLGMTENSTFLRGPVFNLIQFPFFKIFSTHLYLSRLLTLLISMITIFVFLRHQKLRLFGIFLFLFSYCEYRIFQFSHYGLSEMVCVNFIMFGMYFLFLSFENEKRRIGNMILASLFIFLCYASKIQFLYAAAVIPATVLVISVRESLMVKKFSLAHYKLFLWSVAFTLIFVMLYYLCWYLPNKELYDYIMSNETTDRFPVTTGMMRTVADFNYRNIFWISNLKAEIIHIYVVIAVVFAFSFIRKKRNSFFVITAFALVWLFTELHKVPMIYLPYRYLLSMFFAGGIFISSAYAAFSEYFPKAKKWLIVAAIGFAIYFSTLNFGAFQRRTWELTSINDYLAGYDLKRTLIIGAWAPSCCWECKATTFPVWDKYFNYKDPVNTYRPDAIIAESDEEDSNQAYMNQGIDLSRESDSVRQFNVWKYRLDIFWIKKK